MVRSINIFGWILVMFCFVQNVSAQGQLIADVQVDQNSVYVGQPVEVTVSVFTSTWFTKGVDLQNIKVNGAFTIYFRSLSTSKIINGKTYAGVNLYYNVFPYDDKDIVFPVLEIKVETPDDGGYKGVSRIVKTNSKNIKVKPIPAGFKKTDWLVTSNMRVQETWSGDLSNVKVGDVLERKVTRTVSDNVSELIPPISWDTIPGISQYPSRSDVDNHKTKTDISATRSDVTRYLFEKEGEVNLPKIELTYWNPRQNKLYKRTLKAQIIHIKPNPDLGMIASIKDSLSAVSQNEVESITEKSELTILGLSLKQFLLVLVIFIVMLVMIVLGMKSSLRFFKRRQEAYLNSELYYFNQFKKASKSHDFSDGLSKLYQWIDQLNLAEPTLKSFVGISDIAGLEDEVRDIERALEAQDQNTFIFNLKLWPQARKQFQRNKSIKHAAGLWINNQGVI